MAVAQKSRTPLSRDLEWAIRKFSLQWERSERDRRGKLGEID